jgi:hypothetical protein
MATAEFRAVTVADSCLEAIYRNEKAKDVANEKAIAEMMAIPYGGFWPFSKPRLRSREECEKSYGEDGHFRSARWWTELSYRRRISRIKDILDLARSSNLGTIRLDEDEAKLVGVA